MADLCAGYGVAIAVGAMVGAVEVFQRYRAEPFKALGNRWGVAYIIFNGAVAALAFFIATETDKVGRDAPRIDVLEWAATAGFGSAALLRAKLLNIKVAEGKDIALGPEIVIQTFLSILDREIDRYRALERFETVRTLFAGIDFDKAKLALPVQVFQAMQTVTEEESTKVTAGIKEAEGLPGDPQVKAYSLGYYLLDLVGEDFLTSVMAKYRDDFVVTAPDAGPPPKSDPPSKASAPARPPTPGDPA